KTPDLIPLCHPIGISGADVDVDVSDDKHVVIHAAVRTADRTGVEMEALTAVAAAALTVVDMIKGTDPAASISDIVVLTKSGGKTGDWIRPDDR
ncbi:MAG: cyclic pyranopterin monophosphate synthase MoaC, partial [Candidatus Nanopelagicales bacterium]